ncbi:plasmid maintenance protein (plasmid) [Borrelia miyamotoi]|uniref:Plasmid maintenance protein n=2 Tax=Borrelia miyamotoi TaxID=47466 RepID=A0AAQ3HFQ9_9SPIR|nr:plasmid maintenance protein [Borrelia miyamotoi]AHH05717.1 Putative cytosolic protein [Borrelia miyamotoi FR64b]ATQ15313.1 plasmid maintenance protein [Borrelia miyamotoi]ATQ16496.1 plasmid maintenance protein [Borrelia miyamotoi]ATQ17643.1 plasmid maintenance protein [Borrelia miyamotoi]ATQ18906.1 plasmid maintenance protein [Borrelia miyamotoi]
MPNTNLEVQAYTKPLKKYHSRYYKIMSILRYFQNNALKYNQTAILNALNTFLLKDGLKQITLRTLRKDLAFLCNKGIIKKTLLRLGEGNGTYIRYTVTKYSIKNLKKILKAKEEIVEHDATSIYKFTKETQKKYYLQNKGIKIFKRKNATKNVSQYITNNRYINNKEKKERETKSEETNNTNYLIRNVSKWKTMRYLDKIEENENKKRYEDSMLRTKKWLEALNTENNTYKS